MAIDQFEPKNLSVFDDEFDEIPRLTTSKAECVTEKVSATGYFKLMEELFGTWYGPADQPKQRPTYRQKVEARFWPKVDKRGEDECWRWIGAQLPAGYGRFSFLGQPEYAHRIAFYLSKGRLPLRDVLHTCRNSNCVNPKHLRERASSKR